MKLNEIILIVNTFNLNIETTCIYDHVITDGTKRVDIFTETDAYGRVITTKLQYWKNYLTDWGNYTIYAPCEIDLPKHLDDRY